MPAQAQTLERVTGFYDFYDAGDGLVMLRIYRPDGEFGSANCLEHHELEAWRRGLDSMGYVHASPMPAWAWRERLFRAAAARAA